MSIYTDPTGRVKYDTTTGDVELDGEFILRMYKKQDRIAAYIGGQASRIAELEAKIVRLERFTKKQAKQLEACAGKGQEWISVDTLPEIGIYQVFINPAMSHSFQAVATFFEGSFSVDRYENSNASDLITHWMPLPSPPKDKESYLPPKDWDEFETDLALNTMNNMKKGKYNEPTS